MNGRVRAALDSGGDVKGRVEEGMDGGTGWVGIYVGLVPTKQLDCGSGGECCSLLCLGDCGSQAVNVVVINANLLFCSTLSSTNQGPRL